MDERRRWWEVVMIDGGGSRLDIVEVVEVRLMIFLVVAVMQGSTSWRRLTLDRRMQLDSTTQTDINGE